MSLVENLSQASDEERDRTESTESAECLSNGHREKLTEKRYCVLVLTLVIEDCSPNPPADQWDLA
jgi:hypothetical protein